MGRLLILFIMMPVLELWLLIRVGSVFGAAPTVALVLLTGIVGAGLARREGLRTMREFVDTSARGEIPTKALFDGAAILIGAAFLLTPGIITDAVGFALLFRPVRRLLQGFFVTWLEGQFSQGRTVFRGYVHMSPSGTQRPGAAPAGGPLSARGREGPSANPSVVEQVFDEPPRVVPIADDSDDQR
jgi:UPF0716 protein FxsA